MPGILAGWRPDIQGKQRPGTPLQTPHVLVKTTHGQVQGFIVDLYDNPDPESTYRPGTESIERVTGTTAVFLGIPYAQPPIIEGRFKVISLNLNVVPLFRDVICFSLRDGTKVGSCCKLLTSDLPALNQ